MVYDPAFDMPKPHWRQQGSFENGTVPPVTDPDAGTQVCIGPFAREWLPYILGAMDQLRNPSSWIVADDVAMFATLARVTRLRQIFSQADTCVSAIPPQLRLTDGGELQLSVDGGTTWTTVDGWNANLCPTIAACDLFTTNIRLESCQLQSSTDGGATWTTAAGWDPGFAECVQEQIPVIGLPPNPGDEPPLQFACSIAGYLANNVILKAITQAITSITDDIALLGFGTIIVDLIPEFVLVTAAYNAFTIIYTAISEGTIADYEAARDDATLWHQVQCAIYGCISGDGYVKESNFACIVSAIEAIDYVHSDVISLIASFVSSLGWVGLAQLSQRAGLVPGADCSDCGTWCYEWSIAAGTMNTPPWGLVPGDTNTDPTGVFTVAGDGIESKSYGGSTQLHIYQTYSPTTITSLELLVLVPEDHGVALRGYSTKDGTFDDLPGNAEPIVNSWFFDGAAVNSPSDRLEIIIDTATIGHTTTEQTVVSRIRLTGYGVNPFGESNCM